MTYQVGFNKMSGFFLTAHPDLTVIEEKVYGNHEKKADKVLNAFKNVNRNFGVILSGQKGIGKSLFARVLARKSLAQGYPLIIVDQYIPGIANFIASIDQEVLVLFDEFEKSFGKCSDNERDPQEEMLSLFDGVNGGKKLFIITCNKSSDLNEFLINRPGRFHYHFTFSNPSPEEIEEYLGNIETISECVVVGRQQNETVTLVALVYPDYTKYAEGTPNEVIEKDIETAILAMNKHLPSYKQVKKTELRDTPFEKTSSRKIKRHLLK